MKVGKKENKTKRETEKGMCEEVKSAHGEEGLRSVKEEYENKSIMSVDAPLVYH